MENTRWNDWQIMQKLNEFFRQKDGKYIITPEPLRRLLADPRCPGAGESTMIEYLEQVMSKLDAASQKDERPTSN